MKIWIAAVTLVLLQDKPLFEEKFKENLSNGWTWVREDAAGWKLEGGALKIKTQPGTLFYKSNNAKNVLLRKSPVAGTEAQRIAFEATVENAPAKDAEQVGLLFYIDDDNYVKIVREYLKGKTSAVLAHEVKRNFETQPAKEDAAGSYRLRLIWAGPKIYGSYKTGDADWIELGSYETPAGDNPQFGVCAHGAAADADRWATIKDLKILKLPK
jgi:regulation of enolase protein 1 (concanavalin A-like superfamily)